MEFDELSNRVIGLPSRSTESLDRACSNPRMDSVWHRHPRGAAADIHEARRRQDRTADLLQRHPTEEWHQAFRSLIPSCSSCPSW